MTAPIRSVLVGCECSGEVRDAFMALGWDAWSCDLQPSETIGNHIRGDIFAALRSRRWDLVILHPPCTYLTVSANTWLRDDAVAKTPGILTGGARRAAVVESIEFVRSLAAYCEAEGIPYVIENPIGVLSTRWRKPTQTIQPWMFGHIDKKGTCLWLSGVPRLVPTKIIPESQRVATIHRMRPGKHRQRERSRTFRGIATAMAQQWTAALIQEAA